MGIIGGIGVANYANTSSSIASGVTALGGVGGKSISGFQKPPSTASYLVTQSGAYITTQSGNKIITAPIV